MGIYDSGDTAWVFACTVMVMLTLVGIALFHAGQVRARAALHAIAIAAVAAGAMTVAWILVGFSLAYAPDAGAGLIGGLGHAGLADIATSAELARISIPPIGVALFHLSVGLVAATVLSGVAVERMRIGALLVFMLCWSVLVYPVVAHWVLGPDGWLWEWGVLDFGSGTLVGITAGASALGLTLVLGPRRERDESRGRPYSLPLSLAGAGLVVAGWIGITAGSALAAGAVAASAALATVVAAVGGVTGWALIEKRTRSVISASGIAWGAVAGLLAITPAAGYLDPFASLLLGFVAGAVAMLLMRGVRTLRWDDPLGAVRVYGVSAILGMLFVGLFGRVIVGENTEPVGALYGGDAGLIGKQAVAVVAVAGFAFLVSWIIAAVVRASMGLRVSPRAEQDGIDWSELGESVALGDSRVVSEDD